MVSAPYAAKLMADMGAEVIKIERPGAGDRARARGPFPGGTAHPEKSGLFLYLNTNKLGVTLDVSRPEGFELLERLAADADVLIHNVAPSDMDRIGLSFERLRGSQSAPGDDFDYAVGTERTQARLARRGSDAVERRRHLLHQRRRPRASRDCRRSRPSASSPAFRAECMRRWRRWARCLRKCATARGSTSTSRFRNRWRRRWRCSSSTGRT